MCLPCVLTTTKGFFIEEGLCALVGALSTMVYSWYDCSHAELLVMDDEKSHLEQMKSLTGFMRADKYQD